MTADDTETQRVEADVAEAVAKLSWDRGEREYWDHESDMRPFDPTITETDGDDCDRGREWLEIVTEVLADYATLTAARAAGDDLAVEREGDDYVVKVSCDYDIDRIEELLEAVAALAYEKFPHLNPLVHGHRRECEESDHCCGPGSNYLRDHDAEVLTAGRERIAQAIEAEAEATRDADDADAVYVVSADRKAGYHFAMNEAARIARTNPGEGGAE